ncbi:MAG: hypothetical protein AB7S36_10930, partial [Planctomycetota bacterium]
MADTDTHLVVTHPDASTHFEISTDPARLDVPAIHAFLRESYWSPGVPESVVRRAIAGSLAFGLYHGGNR